MQMLRILSHILGPFGWTLLFWAVALFATCLAYLMIEVQL